MALRTAKLRVQCNPWHALDHLGRPAGACPKERLPHHVNGHQGYIGAECVASDPEKLEDGHAGTPDQDTCWHFSRDVVEVPDSAWYRACVANGEVFAADELTAKKCGVKLVPFDKALASAKDAILKQWKLHFGEEAEDADPFKRPEPAGKTAPLDVIAAGSEERSKPQKPAPKAVKEG